VRRRGPTPLTDLKEPTVKALFAVTPEVPDLFELGTAAPVIEGIAPLRHVIELPANVRAESWMPLNTLLPERDGLDQPRRLGCGVTAGR
jgi:hypothetical protein